MPTIGSLCTGIGGLDLAVERHFGADLLWYSDLDPKANEVMAVHRPDALALGDFTAVDPATVEVPDILTAGFPCQPVSSAGLQKGLADPRWLFDDIIDFVDGLHVPPTWMVFENVRNLLSHDDGRTALEVFRQVAGLGFDIEYGVVRASDAGLPHQRARVFIVARHPDGHDDREVGRVRTGAHAEPRGVCGADDKDEAPTHADGLGAGRGRPRQVPGPTGTGEGQGTQRQRLRDSAGHGRPTPTDPDQQGPRPGCAQPPGRSLAGADGEAPTHPDGPSGEAREHPGRSRERLRLESLGCATPPPNPDHPGRGEQRRAEPMAPELRPAERGGGKTEWGEFTEAIRRWELISGYWSPSPVDDKGRLSPRWVEWMMGFEPGWVTDVIPQRTHSLRLLGNSVCPPQAELALALLT